MEVLWIAILPIPLLALYAASAFVRRRNRTRGLRRFQKNPAELEALKGEIAKVGVVRAPAGGHQTDGGDTLTYFECFLLKEDGDSIDILQTLHHHQAVHIGQQFCREAGGALCGLELRDGVSPEAYKRGPKCWYWTTSQSASAT